MRKTLPSEKHCGDTLCTLPSPVSSSSGDSQSLVQLLHAKDGSSDLLTKKDEEYATYLSQHESQFPQPQQQSQQRSPFQQLYASLYDENGSVTVSTFTPEDALYAADASLVIVGR